MCKTSSLFWRKSILFSKMICPFSFLSLFLSIIQNEKIHKLILEIISNGKNCYFVFTFFSCGILKRLNQFLILYWSQLHQLTDKRNIIFFVSAFCNSWKRIFDSKLSHRLLLISTLWMNTNHKQKTIPFMLAKSQKKHK